MCVGSSSKGNGYALIAENEILLLEAGCRLMDMKKAIDWQIGKVVGCLCTHGHQDHLKHAKEFLSAGIKIYTNDETQEAVDTISGEWVYGMPEMKRFEVGGFGVIPFYVPHNNTPCYAYLIEHEEMGKLLFATDFEYLPWSFKNQCLNHILIECNHVDDLDAEGANYEHVLRGHSSLSTVIEAVKKNRTSALRNVILLHLSHSNADPIKMVQEVEKVAGNCVKVACAESGLSSNIAKDPF